MPGTEEAWHVFGNDAESGRPFGYEERHVGEEELLVPSAEAVLGAGRATHARGRWSRLVGAAMAAAALLLAGGVLGDGLGASRALANAPTRATRSTQGPAEASRVAKELELQLKAEAFDKHLSQQLDVAGRRVPGPQPPRDLLDGSQHHQNSTGIGEPAPARQEFPDMGEVSHALLDALGARAEQVASDMTGLDVANILNAYALLLNPPSDTLLGALGKRAQQTANDMGGREVARVLNAFARFGAKPEVGLLGALGDRTALVAGNMSAQDVSDMFGAYLSFELAPEEQVLSALSAQADQVMSEMDAHGVVGVLSAHAAFGKLPSKSLLGSLQKRVTQVANLMDGKEVASAVNSYMKLGVMPGPDLPMEPMWQRGIEVTNDMDAQDVATMFSAYAAWEERSPSRPGNANTTTTTRGFYDISKARGEHNKQTSDDRKGALPPWWILHHVKPTGEKDHGSYKSVTFDKEQQAQFGIDEEGKIVDKRRFEEALKALDDPSSSSIAEAETTTEAEVTGEPTTRRSHAQNLGEAKDLAKQTTTSSIAVTTTAKAISETANVAKNTSTAATSVMTTRTKTTAAVITLRDATVAANVGKTTSEPLVTTPAKTSSEGTTVSEKTSTAATSAMTTVTTIVASTISGDAMVAADVEETAPELVSTMTKETTKAVVAAMTTTTQTTMALTLGDATVAADVEETTSESLVTTTTKITTETSAVTQATTTADTHTIEFTTAPSTVAATTVGEAMAAADVENSTSQLPHVSMPPMPHMGLQKDSSPNTSMPPHGKFGDRPNLSSSSLPDPTFGGMPNLPSPGTRTQPYSSAPSGLPNSSSGLRTPPFDGFPNSSPYQPEVPSDAFTVSPGAFSRPSSLGSTTPLLGGPVAPNMQPGSSAFPGTPASPYFTASTSMEDASATGSEMPNTLKEAQEALSHMLGTTGQMPDGNSNMPAQGGVESPALRDPSDVAGPAKHFGVTG